jgi:release factor glutamine methyltransferase
LDLSSLIAEITADLKRAGVPSPEVDARRIAAHVLGIGMHDIHLEPGRGLEPAELAGIRELARRREERVPLQYLTGGCEFMSLPFRIKEGVFIPRPETETLVEALLAAADRHALGPRLVLDLCTGSGVVAVALARHLGDAYVVASDLSPVAVEMARGNAILNGVGGRMGFVVGADLDFADSRGPVRRALFDLVACNPPYVEQGEIDGLQPEISEHEPVVAIDGGRSGLEFIERVLPRAASMIREGGLMGFEIGAGQARAVVGLFEASGLREVQVHRDLAGRDRAVLGWRL